ncbi:uncharacterized protein LOC127454318 [Myxocyprinus asiaticus]|uniref:uncharacterized protein LOC127454318 n=1 Tax=Myxocyprinus asiaticus TaxID=70543 RepID=UPI002221FA1C|nr:uncharacterized protein LOC127454318 [Myxocyprinus asiaticus]
MGLWRLVWILCMMPVFVHGEISVNFKTGRPLYVALGKTLVLEAVFQKNPEDKIDMVTWDHEREKENIRISGTVHDKRISLEKDNALLRITNISRGDFGTYKVTVTDSNGDQQHDSIEVRMMEQPLKVSIVNLLECFVDTNDVAQWDTPQFLWFVDGVEVTTQTALLANGRRLNISQVKGDNYTCITHSSLGTVTTHYETSKETQTSSSYLPCCKGLIAAGVALALLFVACVLFMMRSRKRHLYVPTDVEVAVPN